MILLLLAFLLTALTAYVIFGGADFGGGVLEASLHKYPKLQKKLQHTLAPVWEANHVWLIAVVVIMFIGFPKIFSTASTLLFVPICLALLAIIIRGCFFTFRKYDPDGDKRESLYSFLFRTSSFLAPIMFGFIVAALLQTFPDIKATPTPHFADLYIYPWLTIFGLFCGLFVSCLFAYLASIFFHGELKDQGEKDIIFVRAKLFFIVTFILGACVFAVGISQNIYHSENLFKPEQLICQLIATLCIPAIYIFMRRNRMWLSRTAASCQVFMIFLGWFMIQADVFIRIEGQNPITFSDSLAPPATVKILLLVLTLVVILVIPMLAYLYYIFHQETDD
ncbi:MAG: cytochrome d ubiquinol oxidase subunit II [Lentisphaeria bacterium]|nr:cytochrome d ubiquinol oxidase subunit II [Lentisphaeria bacterium]